MTTRRRRTARRITGWLDTWAGLLFYSTLLAVVFLLATTRAQHDANVVERSSAARARARQAETIAACLRGNVVRARITLDDDAAELIRDLSLLPILDCRRTVLEGNGMAMPLAELEQRRYIADVRSGRAPSIDRNGIVH